MRTFLGFPTVDHRHVFAIALPMIVSNIAAPLLGLVDTGSTWDHFRAYNPKKNGSVLAPATQNDLRRGGFGVATPALVVAIGCGRCRGLRIGTECPVLVPIEILE